MIRLIWTSLLVVSLAASAAASSSTTITLQWTAPGDDGTSGTAVQYDIRYSTSMITEANWNSATQAIGEPIPAAPGTLQSDTLTGLTPSTTYYIAIKAADEVPNWSGMSNVVAHTTDPMSVPTTPTLFSPTDGVIDVTQPIVLDWSTEATATSYDVQVDDNSNFSSPVYNTSRTSSYLTVSGLNLETRFYWRVRSVNASGTSAWTTAWSFVTQSFISGADDITASSDTAYTTARPTLTLWNGARSESNRYFFEVSRDSSFIPSNVVARSGEVPEQPDGSASWHVDQNLSAGQTYYWRAALNEEGYSAIFKFSVNPESVHAYPSPFDRSKTDYITFTEIPENATLVVTTLVGDVVMEWPNTTGGDIKWDGKNKSNRPVAPGAYFWFVRGSDQRGGFAIEN